MGGGSYYTFCLASSQASVFAAIYAYNLHATPPQGVEKIDARILWAGASALAGAWLCTFLYFTFSVAVPTYRHTLWSRTSGRQCTQADFLKGKDDEAKFNVFRRNLLLWDGDIGEEVKKWTAEGWARWKEEKPVWFKVEIVPDRFVPAGELEQLGYNRKRRGSAVESMRESVRESMREDDDGGEEDGE
jgi:hypothetical protein